MALDNASNNPIGDWSITIGNPGDYTIQVTQTDQIIRFDAEDQYIHIGSNGKRDEDEKDDETPSIDQR